MKRLDEFLGEEEFRDIDLIGMKFRNSEKGAYRIKNVRNVPGYPDFKEVERSFFDGDGDIVYLDECCGDTHYE